MSTVLAWVSSIATVILLTTDHPSIKTFVGLLWFAIMFSALLYVLCEHLGPGIRRRNDE
jgi:hypothetical protein